MEDNSAAQQPAQTKAESAPAQKGNEGEVVQNVLTPEAVKAMIEESNRPLHAEIRRLREGAKPKSEQTEAERTLSQRVAAMEAEKAEIAKERKSNQLRTAALKEGVPEDRVDIFVNHVLSQKDAEIVSDRAGALWDQYNDSQTRKPIGELIKSMLDTTGTVFKPQQPLPQARGLRANGRVAAPSRYEDIPQEQRLKMSHADRLKLAQDSVNQ